MSKEYPTPIDLDIAFTDDEDRVARDAINRFGTGSHPMSDDRPGLRAVNFVATYARRCLRDALADPRHLTDEGRVTASAALAKLGSIE
jgi:hypothetical protein